MANNHGDHGIPETSLGITGSTSAGADDASSTAGGGGPGGPRGPGGPGLVFGGGQQQQQPPAVLGRDPLLLRRGSSSSSSSNSSGSGSGSGSSNALAAVLSSPLDTAAAVIAGVTGAAGAAEGEEGEDEAEEAEEEAKKLTNLSPTEIAVLTNLTQRQILYVIDGLVRGETLEETLRAVAPDIISRVTEAEAEQEAADATEEEDDDAAAAAAAAAATGISSESVDYLPPDHFTYNARYVPLRLSYDERRFLRLLEGALEVSEYVDRIDILGGSGPRRTAKEIKAVCSVLAGLAVANDYEGGQRLMQNMTYTAQADFFQGVFEIGRRYKTLNPTKLRSAYGKLMYFLMDSARPDIQQLLQFNLVIPVQTVHSLLAKKRNGLALLTDPLLHLATREIVAGNKTRGQIDREIKEKEAAVKALCKKYAGKPPNRPKAIFGLRFSFLSRDEEEQTDPEQLTVEDIERCLFSFSDFHSHLRCSRDPCERMIKFLKEHFHPDNPCDEFSLSIHFGKDGARLSHTHNRQFLYVLQSLVLWKEITTEMLALWCLAETDMLQRDNSYRLRDTGQGLNRVQDAPRVCRAMRTILDRVQRQTCGWVGSSVVHLGDSNVPNALMFLDKYTQVPRILGPVVLCLDKLDELNSNPSIRLYFEAQFGGVKRLRKVILCDFFRHAFDGSGADNFFDAGSCIDGRLTSAWNWCSTIEKKIFFPVFLLAGFNGFDAAI